MPSRGDNLEHALRLDEGNDALEAFARLDQIMEIATAQPSRRAAEIVLAAARRAPR